MALSLNKPKLDNLADEIWKSAQRLRGSEAHAYPQGPEPDGAAPEQADREPAADVTPARPGRPDEHGQRGKGRKGVVLVLEP